jgi:hypothetical protein
VVEGGGLRVAVGLVRRQHVPRDHHQLTRRGDDRHVVMLGSASVPASSDAHA